MWKGSATSFALHLLMVLALAWMTITDPSTLPPKFLRVSMEEMAPHPTSFDFELSPKSSSDSPTPERDLESPSHSVQLDVSIDEPKLTDEILTDDRSSSIVDWRLFVIEDESSSKAGQTKRTPVGSKSNRTVAMAASAKNGSSNKTGLDPSSQSMNRSGISYFGSRVMGKEFIFVVDGSGSMRGVRWNTAIQELMRSLNDLGSDTEFFIIFFDNSERPLFDHYPPTNAYLTNQGRTLQLVQEWIQNLQMGGGTQPSSALMMALEMNPDAIFLLSDGQIRDNSIAMLRMINRNPATGMPLIPIHTILLMSEQGHLPLQVIAEENGGHFRNVTEREWLAAQARKN